MNDQKIALLTDSCADIPEELLRKYDIYVVPLKLIFSDGEFSDGVDITPREVYTRLKQEMPKTTLPSGESVEQAFARIKQAGYTKALAINFSSGLSGTHNMVRVIGEETVGLEVRAFDTLSGSLGTGMTVLQAARWIEEGWTWTRLLRAMPRLMADTHVFFCVDTLEYLQKGGRIGKISQIAGTLLQIKPIISFAPDGELVNVAKIRGRKFAMEKMVQMAAALVPRGARFNLAVAHGDASAELKEIRTLAQKALPDFEQFLEGEIDCTLGAYVGPHMLGVGIQLLADELFVET
ncbi:DegV family protein [Agathobaculum sp.]|uniref:DegV family protein n=1 Tax=Agathobaculum sp. TaxID=2048138 RepID=UPI002A7FA6B7|nr:DegV family protein [Agathobaculum sp.]MDY3618474.1 DegV family protein [Agathobaculum sp.]